MKMSRAFINSFQVKMPPDQARIGGKTILTQKTDAWVQYFWN